ncbi:MAG: hypothetical protein WKG01_28475 [Kofleriaceae bacterium]
MRWTDLMFVAVTLGSCGGPILRNAPQPNTAKVAGVAAAAAAAVTLADPNAAQRNVEANKVPDEKKPQKSGPSVPADVLDRLESNGSGSQAAPVTPAPPPPAPESPPDLSGVRPLRK